MFNNCCENPYYIHYTLEHKPKPLKMIPELRDTIDRLLWYVPGIDSFQSCENYLVDDYLYSYPILEEVLSSIGLNLDEDINLLSGQSIDDSILDFFNEMLCVNCQKVIMTKYNNETWLRALLRHIRNSIAHGRFTVVGPLVLFKDKKPRSNKFTSFMKVNAVALNEALKIIEDFGGVERKTSSGYAEEKIISRVFQRQGFEVSIDTRIGKLRADIIAMKNEKKYAIEIKRGNFKKIGYQDKMISYMENMFKNYLNEGFIPVLIYDRGWLSSKANNYLKEKEFLVFDKRDLSKLFKGGTTLL